MKLRKLFGLFAALVIASGCGKPKPKNIETVSLIVPEYSTSKSFSFSSAQGSRSFFGQMLIWDPEVSGTKVSEVLTFKRKANEAMVARLRSLDDYMKSVLAPASAELSVLKKDVEAIELEAAPRIREQSLALARDWFENAATQRLATEAPSILAGTRDVFSAYCEAKLFAFGTTYALAALKYSDRPSPLALCENVYKDRGFFADASCASGGEPKNYFECIWKHGILRTRFANRYTLDQKIAMESMAENPNFRRIFAGTVDPGCSIVKIRGPNRISTSASPSAIANLILIGAKNQELNCNGIQGSFSLQDVVASASELEKASPSKIAGDIESRNVNCASMICVVPNRASDGAEPSKHAQEFGLSVSRKLMSFASQSLSCGSEKQLWWTQNFAVFNAPITKDLDSRARCNEPASSDVPPVIATDGALERSRANFADALSTFQAKKLKACLNAGPLCDESAANNMLAEIERNAASEASVAALQRGVAVAIIPSFGVSTRTENGFDIVTVALESISLRASWSSCLRNGVEAECPAGVLSPSEKRLRAASFNYDTGVLAFEIPIDDSRIFGHAEYGVHPLVERDFLGSVLRVELLPALMGDFLPYLSGYVYVQKSGVNIYQGVSYAVDDALTRAHEKIYYSF